jgi:hypothetical protein
MLLTANPTTESSVTLQLPEGTRASTSSGLDSVGKMDIETLPFVDHLGPMDHSILSIVGI